MLNSRVLEENIMICLRLCCWTYLPKLDKNESHKVKINEVDFIKSSCSVTKSCPTLHSHRLQPASKKTKETEWEKAVIKYKRKDVNKNTHK